MLHSWSFHRGAAGLVREVAVALRVGAYAEELGAPQEAWTWMNWFAGRPRKILNFLK